MSDSIGHIIKDSLGDQLTHSPSKSFVNRCETRLRLLLLFLVCSLSNFVSLKAHPLFVSSGMNIDGASNMKYLPIAEGIDSNPNKAIHLGWNDVHRGYNQMMKQRMDELYDISKIEGWNQRRIQKEVVNLQTEVRQRLDSGKYKIH